MFAVCPPPFAWGRPSCYPRGHPPPGAQISQVLATQAAAGPQALWVPRGRASPPRCMTHRLRLFLSPSSLGPFPPSCSRGQSCLEEASPDGEECDLLGICPQGAVQAIPGLGLDSIWPPPVCVQLHLEAWTTAVPALWGPVPRHRLGPGRRVVRLCAPGKPRFPRDFTWNTWILRRKQASTH